MKPDNFVYIAIDEIIPHPKNPKKHPPFQVEAIGELIKTCGWGRSIVLSQDNYILAGHGAVEAAIKIGHTKVPYTRMKWNHNDPEAITYLLGDNKANEESTWDSDVLYANLEELDKSNLNVNLTMFTDQEIGDLKELLTSDNDLDIPNEKDIDESIANNVPIITCPKCGYEIPKDP